MIKTIIISILIIYFIISIINIASFWKIFEKSGYKGWYSIIPIFNLVILLKTGQKPWWWIFLLIIPVINIIFLFLTFKNLSKNFGKSTFFSLGLTFLGLFFLPILAFGKAELIKNK